MNYSEYKKEGWDDTHIRIFLQGNDVTARVLPGGIISFGLPSRRRVWETEYYDMYALKISDTEFRYFDTREDAEAARVMFSLPNQGSLVLYRT